jgi:predicted NBD/HSP70 family sugar kinase
MFIFIDIGGTKTRIGVSYDGNNLDEKSIFDTNQNYAVGLKTVYAEIEKYVGDSTVQAIVMGLPGTLHENKSMLVRAPHLVGWENKNIVFDLSSKFSCDVYLENDAALVGLGEAVYGAGAENNIVAYITLSTGVGGARIVDKTIDANTYGFEIGHQYIKDGVTFEETVSGTHIEKVYSMHPKEIVDTEVWQKYTKDVAVGVANAVTFWSPDIIVIGGSMARSVLFEQLNTNVKELCPEYETIPKIVPYVLDNFGGLYGGLAYIQNIGK